MRQSVSDIDALIPRPAGLGTPDESMVLAERTSERRVDRIGGERPWPVPASEVDPSRALDDAYLIDGVLRPGRLMVLAAAEGVGKSRARMEIAMRLATGHGALFDHYRIPGRCRVLTIEVENGDEEEIRREEETRERLGLERSALTDYYRVSLEGLSLVDPEDQAYVLAAVGRVRPSVVVFDTGSTMVGDEWGQPLKDAVRFLRLVAREYGCAVIVLVHLVKASRQAKKVKDSPHGTELADVMGQWTRQADSVALMADTGADRTLWSMRKRVPSSTLVLERTDGTFHALQVVAGEDLGVGTTQRVLTAIATGMADVDAIADYMQVHKRTVWRHVRRLREEGKVAEDGPLRLSHPVTAGVAV